MTHPDGNSLGRRTVHTIVADPHRRHVLSRLEPGERTTVTELAREIAAVVRDEPAASADRSVRRRIEIALVHDHLPRLADHDVVEYAPREDVVVLTDDPETLQPLEAAIDGEPTIDAE